MVKPQEERAGGLLLCPTSQACCWHCLLSSTVGQLELPLDHTGLCTLVSLSGKVLIICLDMDLLLQDWGCCAHLPDSGGKCVLQHLKKKTYSFSFFLLLPCPSLTFGSLVPQKVQCPENLGLFITATVKHGQEGSAFLCGRDCLPAAFRLGSYSLCGKGL